MSAEFGISTVETSTVQKSLFARASAPWKVGPATLKSGQNLVNGAVLGIITGASVSSAAKSGGNTGNGTLVMDATTPMLANVQAGVYTVRNIISGTNTGTFIVTGPDGKVVGEPIIPAGAGGSITFANQIKFALTDGTTDFALGDGFDITVVLSGKYVAWSSSATDGSQNIAAILCGDVDATSGDKGCQVYVEGEFNKASLTYSGSISDGIYAGGNIIIKGEA